jgi:hypothetical protein
MTSTIASITRNSLTLFISATCFALTAGSAHAAEQQLAPPVIDAPAGTPTVTCDKAPGAGLCYALSDAGIDFTYTSVSGASAVDAVLNGQASSASNITTQFEMAVLPTDVVSAQIGKAAYYISWAICSIKTTTAASDSYNAMALVAENKALPKLAALQTAAGVKNVKTCKLTVK